MSDISIIKTPSGDEYNVKDSTARSGLSNKVDKVANKELMPSDLIENEKISSSYLPETYGTITGVSVNGSSVATSGVANITSIPGSIVTGELSNGVEATTQSAGDNSKKVATTAYVDGAISNKVNKSGDTITGSYNFKSANIDRTQNPESTTTADTNIKFTDTNDYQLGNITTQQLTDGRQRLYISTNSGNGSTMTTNHLSLYVDRDGNCSYAVGDEEAFRTAINCPQNKQLTNENLNSITVPGFYNATSNNTCANKPVTGSFGLLVIHTATGNYWKQYFFPINNTAQPYFRSGNNGTWTDWQQDALYDTNGDLSANGLSLKKTFMTLTGTGTVGSTSGTTYYPSKWKFDAGVTPEDGTIVVIKIPVAGHANGVYVSTDNETTYKPVITNGTSILSTHFVAGVSIALLYQANATTNSMAPLNGGDKASQTGGAWRVLNFYDANSSVTQNVKSDNVDRPLLMSNYNVGTTTTTATSVNRAQNMYANASTGKITATTFAGDLNGTINSATTAITQAQGDNSTKVATTAYVDTAIGSGGASISVSGTTLVIDT